MGGKTKVAILGFKDFPISIDEGIEVVGAGDGPEVLVVNALYKEPFPDGRIPWIAIFHGASYREIVDQTAAINDSSAATTWLVPWCERGIRQFWRDVKELART